jgi:hypothetical protein
VELEAFAYSISHDLHALLRSIYRFSHVLRETKIWNNLLANAVNYTRKHSPAVIEIGLSETPQGPAFFFTLG